MDTADPQQLVRALRDKGVLDCEADSARSLPALLARVDAWPREMPRTDVLEDLGLTEADLQHEECEACEARRKAEAEKRTIKFGGKPLDTGREDFAALFEHWLTPPSPRDRLVQPKPAAAGCDSGAVGWQAAAQGPGRRQGSGVAQPTRLTPCGRAMGIASEWLGRYSDAVGIQGDVG